MPMTERCDERQAFERAWAKRPWHRKELTDKDKAWFWWQAARNAVGEIREEEKP